MQCKLLDIMRARQQMMSRVNFINIQQAAYAHTDPKSVKKTDNLTVFFCAFRIHACKGASRMLMKLTPG
jgi:hypothetical protein